MTARKENRTRRGHWLPMIAIIPWMLLGLGCEPSRCADETDCGELPVNGPDTGGVRSDGGSSPGNGTDAGTGLDAGTGPDAGTPRDGGTHPGGSCLERPHDPQLGTLSLQPGFTLAETAALPEDLTAVTAVPSGVGFKLYGLRGSDKSLHALGTWPRVALGTTPLHYVVAPEDRTRVVILSDFLVNDGSRLLAGYIRSTSSGDGKVLVYDLANPAGSQYLAAPGNASAAAATNALFVNGMGLNGLGAPGSDAALYALKTQAQPFQAVKLALFDPDWAAGSGRSALTANGIAIFGYFSALDEQEHLHAVPPAVHAQALSSGTPFALADWPEIHAGSSQGLLLAGFGSSLAVHRGSVSETTGSVDTQDVIRIPLTLGSSTRPSVSAGPSTPVLVSSDPCTNVSLLVSMGKDLLVGISDKNGGRLIRLQAQE